jgi:hypothetical protein
VPWFPTPIHPAAMRLLGAILPALPSTDEGITYGNATAAAAKRAAFFRKRRLLRFFLPTEDAPRGFFCIGGPTIKVGQFFGPKLAHIIQGRRRSVYSVIKSNGEM